MTRATTPIHTSDTARGPIAPTEPAREDPLPHSGRRIRVLDHFAIALPVLVLAVMGWHRRWITDDGLIYIRAAREILAGNGPVYSPGERVETSTGTLWQWLLALLDLLTPGDPARTAVYAGLVLSIAGTWLALAGTRRFLRAETGRFLVPAGALVFVALPPVWDFATSGLETGLMVGWIGLSWRLLVTCGEHSVTTAHRLGIAAMFGLGPLIRPELAATSIVFLVAMVMASRLRRRAALAVFLCAGALPGAYQVFRMGYYGLPYPMPAVTKSANRQLWGRGFDYLVDFAAPYRLWIPTLLVVLIVAALLIRRGPRNRRTWLLGSAPAVAAAVQCGYVLRVGGDFMHGRMWLPVLMLGLLPILLVPVDRRVLALVVLVPVWATWCGFSLRSGLITTPGPRAGVYQTWNERMVYVNWTRTPNPTTSHAHSETLPGLRAELLRIDADGRHVLVLDGNYLADAAALPPLPLRADLPAAQGLIMGRLGVGGVVTPLGGVVVDVWGLANTVGAHIEPTGHIAAGHEKLLPLAWNIALYVDPAAWARIPAHVVPIEDIRAARAALDCGDLRELLRSTTEPMSPGRFLRNLTGSFDRAALTIPPDPKAAERKFCAR
ncbi:hypothetical protein [Embleya sp. NBC_00896]|uniref:hypothetical protein n=1 Tax=Embleya sp. NBC_00896 TaxID=2975961 RepID=UPI00386AF803|nr:hypothetical protein OG928_06145 [Embleya sp. NBC_00896]